MIPEGIIVVDATFLIDLFRSQPDAKKFVTVLGLISGDNGKFRRSALHAGAIIYDQARDHRESPDEHRTKNR